MMRPENIMSRDDVLLHFDDTLNEELRLHPNVIAKASTHFKNSPKDKFIGKYHVFVSGGMNDKLLYVFYDDAFWNKFVGFFEEEIQNHLACGQVKTAFIGSNDDKHTIVRLAYSMEKRPFVRGFQSGLGTIVQDLSSYKPNVLVCYGGFLEYLFETHKSSALANFTTCFKLIITTTEGVSDACMLWLKTQLEIPITSILSCTEAGVFARTCEIGHYHMYEPEMLWSSGSEGIVLSCTSNSAQQFGLYKLPLKIDRIDNCPCGLGEGFTISHGRYAKFITLKDKQGRKVYIHPVQFRTELDSLPHFPGASVSSRDEDLLIELKGNYNQATLLERINNVLVGCNIDIIKTKVTVLNND